MQSMKSSLIINSPYKYPSKHWKFSDSDSPPELVDKRRSAGYLVSDPRATKPYQDMGVFIELPLVNKIRQRVDKWRDAGRPGITGVTKALLEHWQDEERRERRFFFCQIEAIETLIWLIETPDSEKTGIDVEGDGGSFRRLCSKLATGTGKTVVMAMLIAWQVINKATYPNDGRFSKNIFVVAPNLTVRERLSVLMPSEPKNYYEEFDVVPVSLREKLAQAKVLIRNWHALQWDSEEKINKKKSVDKRSVKSDNAYARDVLGDMAKAKNIIVINDEAHHAWRIPAGSSMKGIKKDEEEEATIWVGGLDRLHEAQGILTCFDFSATPFAPGSNRTTEESLFRWIVSDFGLNDAIEAGLVKTPHIAIDDDTLSDSGTNKSRLYHIYSDPDVKADLNRKARSHEPLPQLIKNAYFLLGADWDKVKKEWADAPTPPVMITVTNRTETAERIAHAFRHKHITDSELFCNQDGILHIDSKVLKKEEAMESSPTETDEGDKTPKARATKKAKVETLREKVNTVGQEGKPGEKIQNVISVDMLSEGWDAHTVTHIMGLRAFTSQLLCEQVVGRGLRRSCYDVNEDTGLFEPEYVEVFGVPFTFLPHERTNDGGGGGKGNKITVQPLDSKQKFAIQWPNVIRIDRAYKHRLSVDWEKVDPLPIDATEIIEIVEMAETVGGKPDISRIRDIDLEEFMRTNRKQTLIFKAAQSVYEEIKLDWKIPEPILIAELVRLAEQFINSDLIEVKPKSYNNNELRRKLVIALKMTSVIRHFGDAIKQDNTEKTSLVLDSNHPICSTGDMRPWRTGKPTKITKKSHINRCVFDSRWEGFSTFQLDRDAMIDAWVKNDHIGFSVLYVHNGVLRRYYPDFIIRLKSGQHLVLEVKGWQPDIARNDEKHRYMKEWVQAVNEDGKYGVWAFEIAKEPAEIIDVLAEYANNQQNQEQITG